MQVSPATATRKPKHWPTRLLFQLCHYTTVLRVVIWDYVYLREWGGASEVPHRLI